MVFKKKVLFLLLIILLCSLVSAREDLSGYNHLNLNLELTNNILVRGSAKYLEAKLSWYPKQTYRQEATINTEGILDNGEFLFHWDYPSSKEQVYLQSSMKTSSDYVIISKKIPYPSEISSEYKNYLLPAEIIDTNKNIERLSLSLTANIDDYYEAVFKIADWVTTNIDYELDTVAADATKKSSWVLENKYGVCDELTSLFISLLREAGIPARFVSGIAYTNLEELDAWGSHGWAEVYFPGKGWVPFDVTYGEYGYLDATHIKLKDSVDAKDHNLEYSLLSKDASFEALPLEQTVTVQKTSSLHGSSYTASLEVYDEIVDSNSYNLLTVHLKSLLPYYTSSRFQLAKTQGLDVLGNREKNLLFKPYEEKTLYFVLKQTEELPEGYYITYPLKIYDARQVLGNTSFEAKSKNDFYDLNYFKSYLEDQKSNLGLIAITCSERVAYNQESLKLSCESSSSSKARVCVDNNCEYKDLSSFELNLFCDSPGLKTKVVSASILGNEARGLLKYECLDNANIKISLVNISKEVYYDNEGLISFSVKRTSLSIPKNLTIKLVHDNFVHEWVLDSLTDKRFYELKFKGKMLDLKDNEFKLITSFEDELGKTYVEEKTFNIELVNLTLGQRIMIYLYDFQRVIDKLILKI